MIKILVGFALALCLLLSGCKDEAAACDTATVVAQPAAVVYVVRVHQPRILTYRLDDGSLWMVRQSRPILRAPVVVTRRAAEAVATPIRALKSICPSCRK